MDIEAIGWFEGSEYLVMDNVKDILGHIETQKEGSIAWVSKYIQPLLLCGL